jgi:hypothetical protein
MAANSGPKLGGFQSGGLTAGLPELPQRTKEVPIPQTVFEWT